MQIEQRKRELLEVETTEAAAHHFLNFFFFLSFSREFRHTSCVIWGSRLLTLLLRTRTCTYTYKYMFMHPDSTALPINWRYCRLLTRHFVHFVTRKDFPDEYVCRNFKSKEIFPFFGCFIFQGWRVDGYHLFKKDGPIWIFSASTRLETFWACNAQKGKQNSRTICSFPTCQPKENRRTIVRRERENFRVKVSCYYERYPPKQVKEEDTSDDGHFCRCFVRWGNIRPPNDCAHSISKIPAVMGQHFRSIGQEMS